MLPSEKKFAVKKCSVNTGSASYTIFDPENGQCDNTFIALDWQYAGTQGDNPTTEVRIQHQLFLLGDDEHAGQYTLVCDVKVCSRDDLDSDCNAWTTCLATDARDSYVCDSRTCTADLGCVSDYSVFSGHTVRFQQMKS